MYGRVSAPSYETTLTRAGNIVSTAEIKAQTLFKRGGAPSDSIKQNVTPDKLNIKFMTNQ